MKKAVSALLVVMIMALGLFTMTKTASAGDEVKMIAVIQTIDLAKDGNSASVVLHNEKTDKDVTVTVDDDLTLSKFKDHRIVEGDEIRLKFEPTGDKNHSTYFRKTAGCIYLNHIH